MRFAYSDEQQMLQSSFRSFLEAESPESEVRRLMDTPSGFDEALWRKIAVEMGAVGLAIPEEFGGLGNSFQDLCIILEETGRALLVAPFFSTAVLAAFTLLESGDEAARQRFLPAIASGEITATLAVTEGAGGWEESGVNVRATPSEGGFTLTGAKTHVLDGLVARLILVAARTNSGVSIFAVEGDAPGLVRTALSTMDQTRKLARVEFADTPAQPVGPEGAGWSIIDQVVEYAATALAAEQAGGAQKCLEIAVDHAKNRVQFGRTIGSFQAVKHMCAEMLVQVELAKTAARYAAACAGALDPDRHVAASMAKSYCSTAYYDTAALAIQVLGGIGFTWEHAAHLYLKRAKSSELMFGDPSFHRRRLLSQLGI